MSQRGVKGDIRFSGGSDGRVVVTADLSVAQGAEGEYTWGIYEFPIDYTKVRPEPGIIMSGETGRTVFNY